MGLPSPMAAFLAQGTNDSLLISFSKEHGALIHIFDLILAQ